MAIDINALVRAMREIFVTKEEFQKLDEKFDAIQRNFDGVFKILEDIKIENVAFRAYTRRLDTRVDNIESRVTVLEAQQK